MKKITQIKYNITIVQYKIWILILQKYSKLYTFKQIDKEDYFYLSKSFLDKKLGYEISKKELKNNLKELSNKKYNFIDLEDNRIIDKDVFYIGNYHFNSKRLTIELPASTKKYIESFDFDISFASGNEILEKINWDIWSKFPSKKAVIIYLMCVPFLRKKRTPYIGLNFFKNIIGLKEGQYPSYVNLNRCVIKKSINIINELSDIEISLVPIKKSRKVIGIYFTINKK